MNIDQTMKSALNLVSIAILSLILLGCDKYSPNQKVYFATSGEYPPFEYVFNGKLIGFEIDLGKTIAEELGKEAAFKNMPFGSVLAALKSGTVDAAISTITMTTERKKNFDFSIPYYTASISIIFPKNKPIKTAPELKGKKIACQLGTTMEIWLKKYSKETEIITNDNNNQAIESLKAGHVDGVLIDSAQGSAFSKNNKNLSYTIITQADSGYGIAFKKGSPLKDDINMALASLEKKGVIEKLKKKYCLEDAL